MHTYTILRLNPGRGGEVSVQLSANTAQEALELYASTSYAYYQSFAKAGAVFIAARQHGLLDYQVSADIAVGKIVPNSGYKVASLHG